MSIKKQNDVIQDITEQTLLTLDGVAEEISKQSIQEEVDNFIAERALKEDAKEINKIKNIVQTLKAAQVDENGKRTRGSKTNFGEVIKITPSSITFKANDTPETKIKFDQRKIGSKTDYILSALTKMNEGMQYESMDDMHSLDDMENLKQSILKVIKGSANALFIGGPPGIGKTFKTEKILKSAGADYVKKPYSPVSGKDLYSLLFSLKDKIILFDNIDGTFNYQDTRDILKAATAPAKVRKLEWNRMGTNNVVDPKDMTDEEILDAGMIPRYFEFTGKIIFISGLSLDKLIQGNALDNKIERIYLKKENTTNEDMEDTENMEAEEEETIETLAAKLELTDEQVETLAAKSNEKYEEEGDAVLLDMLKMVAMPTDEEHKSAMMELIVNGDFDALEAHIAEMKEKQDGDESEEMDEAISWDLIQSMYVKDLMDFVIAPLVATGIYAGVRGYFAAKQKIKDWLADQKDDGDAKLIKDAIEKIKKDSTAQDMIAQINAVPYDRNSNNAERTKLIKPYKAHLKAILSDEQYEVLNDIYFESLKEESEDESDMKEAKSQDAIQNEIDAVAEKLGLTDEQLNKLHFNAKKVYSGSKTLPALLAVLNFIDGLDNEPTMKRVSMGYATSGQFGMLDLIINDRDEDMDEQSDMKVDTTDIEELVSSEEGLTEGFKEKASIIFEAAVASKVKETQSMLQEQYATRLQEEVETVKETLVEKIDSYLTYAVETWVADNKVAVESTLRTEITESFIGSLKSLFTEHYIEVPESKVDLFSNMETQVATLKEQVEKKGRIANALADRVEKLTRQKVIAEASSGLADTQIAKLTELVQDVEFINEDTFVKKVATIREFYINGRAANKNTLNENVDDNSSFISTETIVENTIEGESISPSMQNYLSAMSRMNKATTANLVG
jgi:hypothetical protein